MGKIISLDSYRKKRNSVTNVLKGDTTTSSSPTLVRSFTYNAYGDTDRQGGIYAEPDVDDIAYTGACYDKETELYYLMSRYYDPMIAQFISEDSYRGDGEHYWNLYAYCSGDPVNNSDRTGNIYSTINGWKPNEKQKKYLKEYKFNSTRSFRKKYKVTDKQVKYGSARPYKEKRRNGQNCFTYALDYGNKSINIITASSCKGYANNIIKQVLGFGFRIREINYCTSPILPEEHRIAFRYIKRGSSGITGVKDPGWHFMVQTSDGKWADKQGFDPSRQINITNPSTYSWQCSIYDWNKNRWVELDENYNSPTIYFAVTYKNYKK